MTKRRAVRLKGWKFHLLLAGLPNFTLPWPLSLLSSPPPTFSRHFIAALSLFSMPRLLGSRRMQSAILQDFLRPWLTFSPQPQFRDFSENLVLFCICRKILLPVPSPVVWIFNPHSRGQVQNYNNNKRHLPVCMHISSGNKARSLKISHQNPLWCHTRRESGQPGPHTLSR